MLSLKKDSDFVMRPRCSIFVESGAASRHLCDNYICEACASLVERFLIDRDSNKSLSTKKVEFPVFCDFM